MKRIHLLRTTAEPEAAADLLAAGRQAGLRAGWLDLAGAPPGAGPLDRAAGAGALRAVAVGEGRSVAVKTFTGPPVLRDLLRQHFLGCAFVLVRPPDGPAPPPVTGVGDLPLLEPVEGGWRLSPADGTAARLSTPELVARLQSPQLL